MYTIDRLHLELDDFECKKITNYSEFVGLGFASPPTSPLLGHKCAPAGPRGTVLGRRDHWSHAVGLPVEPIELGVGQVPLSGSDPLLGSLGWVEPLGGSTLEGPPVVRRFPLFQLGEVPEHTGQCPGSQWFPSGPSRNSSRNPGREVLGSKRFAGYQP